MSKKGKAGRLDSYFVAIFSKEKAFNLRIGLNCGTLETKVCRINIFSSKYWFLWESQEYQQVRKKTRPMYAPMAVSNQSTQYKRQIGQPAIDSMSPEDHTTQFFALCYPYSQLGQKILSSSGQNVLQIVLNNHIQPVSRGIKTVMYNRGCGLRKPLNGYGVESY